MTRAHHDAAEATAKAAGRLRVAALLARRREAWSTPVLLGSPRAITSIMVGPDNPNIVLATATAGAHRTVATCARRLLPLLRSPRSRATQRPA